MPVDLQLDRMPPGVVAARGDPLERVVTGQLGSLAGFRRSPSSKSPSRPDSSARVATVSVTGQIIQPVKASSRSARLRMPAVAPVAARKIPQKCVLHSPDALGEALCLERGRTALSGEPGVVGLGVPQAGRQARLDIVSPACRSSA
jgi:hypothetical protein